MALVKYNNNSISAVTSTGLATGSLVPIKTLTASSSATLSFVHGTDGVVLDSTYPIYKFEFINIHPATNNADLQFQADTGTNTNYNQTITSTSFRAYHMENDSQTNLGYEGGGDQAQGTGFQRITNGTGTDNDSCGVGTLHLFSPSSSIFVKHFIISSNHNHDSAQYSYTNHIAGYFNTTTALTRVQFKMSSGNIDAGKIKLYGIKDS